MDVKKLIILSLILANLFYSILQGQFLFFILNFILINSDLVLFIFPNAFINLEEEEKVNYDDGGDDDDDDENEEEDEDDLSK